MSLPAQVVDRLFQRMAATYGASWDRSLGQAPITDVKTAWAHELAGFGARLTDIAWALENLPERCPNVIEFRNLARRAPVADVPRLPEPKADPERVKAEIARLAPILADVRKAPEQFDRLGWAKRILARAEGGERIALGTLNIAKEALRMNGLLRAPDQDETPLSPGELVHGVRAGLIQTEAA